LRKNLAEHVVAVELTRGRLRVHVLTLHHVRGAQEDDDVVLVREAGTVHYIPVSISYKLVCYSEG